MSLMGFWMLNHENKSLISKFLLSYKIQLTAIHNLTNILSYIYM